MEPVRSPMASPVDARVVPMWATLRRSLSSDAAASLSIALTRATSFTGSFAPSNQIVASGLPPRSFASSRTMRAESMSEPGAALANVLAMIIFACSTAFAGRSSNRVRLRNCASVSARLREAVRLLSSSCCGLPTANAMTGHAAASALCNRSRLVKSCAMFLLTYRLTYLVKPRTVFSAPYTLPAASTATPSPAAPSGVSVL